MAAKKKKVKHRRVYRHRVFVAKSPEERKWQIWNHDLDSLLHDMVKNPALIELSPEEIVRRAEQFADALHVLQDRRRPPGVDFDGRF